MIESYMPAIATALASGMKAFGLIGQGQAGVTAANRRRQAAQFEAAQLEQNAGQAVAASQRVAFQRGQEADLLLSTLRARAAASGAGASDPTVLNLQAGLMQKKAYNLAAALYEGTDRARTMRMQAAGRRYEGEIGVAGAKDARSGYNFAALTSVMSGAADAGTSLSRYSEGIRPAPGSRYMDPGAGMWGYRRDQ